MPTFREARDFLIANRTDYRAAVAGFEWPKLEHFNWALDHFDVMAQGNDSPALHIVDDASEVKLSFAELSARSNQVANYLRALGVKRGDRMLLMLGNVVPLWEVMLAAMKLGAVVVPATMLLAPADLEDRLARGRLKHVVADSSVTDKFATLGSEFTRIAVGGADGWHDYARAYDQPTGFAPDGETKATDPLLLYFTSGTTAKPKLVLHSHQSYPVGHLSTMYWIGLKPGDVHLNISSPGWAKHAWSCFFAPWNAGACVFIYNQPRFNAATLLAVLAKHRITTFCAPPTVWRMLIQEDLSQHRNHVRELLSAGEPLNPEVIEQVEKAWGLTIRDGFGQTETSAQVGNTPGQPVVPGSMGRPLPGFDIRLLDADGDEVEEGQICVSLARKPVGVMMGYQMDDGTIAGLDAGWHFTGDVATRSPDGSLTFVGRADDVFKSSDYRISPFELESVLIEHPAVAEAAVVPSPDPLRLSVPKAFVTLAPGHAAGPQTALSIFKFLAGAVAPYKRVRVIEFSDLPKTISGKIRRVELRGNEEKARAAQARGPQEYFWDDFKAEVGA
ncbi:AMP-binding protein [Zavarzinia sp. CC-PAN008]|uniref:AMP-binding protein n=1 Tax=Zavarzinia sp. CC-PAN008 TaxID=3243332 RepID=UPI003F742408